MADHAGGPRPVVNPGIRRSNPVLAPEERFWRQLFVRPKKIVLIKRRGNSMKQKLLKMIQVTVWLHIDEFIFAWFYKNENRRQNRSSGTQNWVTLTGRRHNLVPGRVNHATAWSVIYDRPRWPPREDTQIFFLFSGRTTNEIMVHATFFLSFFSFTIAWKRFWQFFFLSNF